ncbi:hypothetical protein [Geodermatophilus ruber]|uniref:Uncharacterized protein n=1 Tax=Geodermatophilus ruber TaxID=504800 RepID=A0A1I4ERU3_9ACTN|nr:hypothetical protein [Geodermatophilus ruber]SFL08428.1 hypothetical protein SAMN04488085_106159 [Geodermatophilus ruber]
MPTALAPQPAALIVLTDIDDLAEADREADLAERLEEAARGERPGPADAVALARAIRRGGAAAGAVHALGPGAAILAG